MAGVLLGVVRQAARAPAVLGRLPASHPVHAQLSGSRIQQRRYSPTSHTSQVTASAVGGSTAIPVGPVIEVTPEPQGMPAYDGPPKLVVFGGSGYVGSRVCEEALRVGLAVTSISRSGAPKQSLNWASNVQWLTADVFDPASWREHLTGAIGVVSCLGAFGTNSFMLKICGDSNILVFKEAKAAGVGRAVFISVHDYNPPGFLVPGYFQGKKRAEIALAEQFPEGGVSLRPTFIHGTRHVAGIGVPLGLVGVPLDRLLGLLPAKKLASIPVLGAGFVPPVSVEAVAKAAVTAATDPSVPSGIMDIWAIKQYESST